VLLEPVVSRAFLPRGRLRPAPRRPAPLPLARGRDRLPARRVLAASAGCASPYYRAPVYDPSVQPATDLA